MPLRQFVRIVRSLRAGGLLHSGSGTDRQEDRMIARSEATQRVLVAKEDHQVTWQAIAQQVGRDPVWTTAALLGQQQMSAEEAERAAQVLGLDAETCRALQDFPTKGSLDPTPPV